MSMILMVRTEPYQIIASIAVSLATGPQIINSAIENRDVNNPCGLLLKNLYSQTLDLGAQLDV